MESREEFNGGIRGNLFFGYLLAHFRRGWSGFCRFLKLRKACSELVDRRLMNRECEHNDFWDLCYSCYWVCHWVC
jgi:hypothetical protein